MSEVFNKAEVSYKNVLSDKVTIKEEGGFIRDIKKAFTKASDYVKAKTGEELYYNDAQIEALKKALDAADSLEDLESIESFGNYKGLLFFDILDKAEEKKESVIKEELEDEESLDTLSTKDRLRLGVYSSFLILAYFKALSEKNKTTNKYNVFVKKREKFSSCKVSQALFDFAYDCLIEEVNKLLNVDDDIKEYIKEELFFHKNGIGKVFPDAIIYLVKNDKDLYVKLKSDTFNASEYYVNYDSESALKLESEFFNILQNSVNKEGISKENLLDEIGKSFEELSKSVNLKLDDVSFKFSDESFNNEKGKQNEDDSLEKEINANLISELKDELPDAEYHTLLKKVKGHILSKFEEDIYENKYVIKFEENLDLSNNKILKISFEYEAIDKKVADEDEKHDNPYKKGKSSNVLFYIGKHLVNSDFSNFSREKGLNFNGNVPGFNVTWNMSLFPLVSDDPSLNEAIMNAQDAIDERKSKLAFLYGKELPETKTEGSDETFVDSNKIISNINKFIKDANSLHKKIKDTATTKMDLEVKELEVVKQASNAASSADASKQETQDDNAPKNTDNKKPKKESLFIENVLNDLCLLTEDDSSLSDLPQGDESKAKESQSAANDLKQEINTFIEGIDMFDGYFFSVILKGYIETGLDYVNKLNFLNTSLDKKSKLVNSEFDQSKKDKMARAKFADQMVRLEEIQNKHYREINSTYRSEVGEMLNKVSSSAEAIITLASAINAGQKKINTILKSQTESEISPENKELCEAWKKSLLAILAREDCVRAGLLPNPETQGNKYVFDKDLTFRYIKTNKTYTYNFYLEVVKEA